MRRIFRGAAVGAVLAAGAIGASAVGVAPAFADGANATTLTLTGSQTSIVTGKQVTFTATISPAKVGTEKISGSVDFTITGADGSTVTCSSITALSPGGNSRCKVDKGVLLAGSAPYSVTASYGGSVSGTFGPSSGSTSLAVSATTTRTKMVLDATPVSGAATTVTATVVDGPATALLSGNVVFTVTSQYHGAGVKVLCSGGNVQALSAGTATCSLPAGWMMVPKVSRTVPKPSGAWSISAVYNGNASFITSFKSKHGTAKF